MMNDIIVNAVFLSIFRRWKHCIFYTMRLVDQSDCATIHKCRQ